mmetsp:Transcript_44736/g.104492  ORF Transcript_44736/g.104492 Transcript_44736/m.104492 type:complete len:207 (-) Transcript_44736:103-723(-)
MLRRRWRSCWARRRPKSSRPTPAAEALPTAPTKFHLPTSPPSNRVRLPEAILSAAVRTTSKRSSLKIWREGRRSSSASTSGGCGRASGTARCMHSLVRGARLPSTTRTWPLSPSCASAATQWAAAHRAVSTWLWASCLGAPSASRSLPAVRSLPPPTRPRGKLTGPALSLQAAYPPSRRRRRRPSRWGPRRPPQRAQRWRLTASQR